MGFMVGKTAAEARIKNPYRNRAAPIGEKRQNQPLFSDWRWEAVLLVLANTQNGSKDRVWGLRLHGDYAIDVLLLLAA